MRRGRAVLDGPPETPRKTAHTVVRIYFRSAGDELLCVDSDLLTWQGADKLKSALAHSAALRVESYGSLEERVAWSGARVVVMPSQVHEGASASVNEAA